MDTVQVGYEIQQLKADVVELKAEVQRLKAEVVKLKDEDTKQTTTARPGPTIVVAFTEDEAKIDARHRRGDGEVWTIIGASFSWHMRPLQSVVSDEHRRRHGAGWQTNRHPLTKAPPALA
ncbi:septum formation initiator family protein [bacterium]|nr:septum formation initiator family protein [bacterium]